MVDIQKALDTWFGKLQKEVATKVPNFAAFFYFMISIGALIGIMVMQHYPGQALMAVLIPALAGAIAYYNRAYATAIFLLIIVIIFMM